MLSSSMKRPRGYDIKKQRVYQQDIIGIKQDKGATYKVKRKGQKALGGDAYSSFSELAFEQAFPANALQSGMKRVLQMTNGDTFRGE